MNLFKDWQAYVSSALTMGDALQRQRIKSLNEEIKEWLKKLDVFAYLPQEYSDPGHGDKMSPEEIYILDRWRVAESDFVIMNLDHPSFGVGQEAEIASSVGVPIIPFYYYEYQVTRILKGTPGIFMTDAEVKPSQAVIEYEDRENYKDLKEKLTARVRLLKNTTHTQNDIKRDPEFSFATMLGKAMKNNKETVQSLAKKTALSPPFIEALLSDHKDIRKMLESHGIFKLRELRDIPSNKYSNPGLWILEKLSTVFNMRISNLIGESELDRSWHSPLIELSKKGVKMEEFIDILDEARYTISYMDAAKSKNDEQAFREVTAKIFRLVEKRRNEGKECK